MRGLFEDFVQLLFLAHELQLMAQVGDHAARHLMPVPGLIILARRTDRQAFALGNFAKMFAHRREHIDIDQRFVAERAQIVGDVENRRL